MSLKNTKSGPAQTAGNAPEPRIYAASRASVPARPAMWKQLRSEGFNIISSWIDEAEPGATGDLGELWERIYREIASADGLVLYVEADDFPLKGALIEAGIALGMGKPVHVVSPDLAFFAPTYRPIGSWITHPNVVRFKNVRQACNAKFERVAASSQEATPPPKDDMRARYDAAVAKLEPGRTDGERFWNNGYRQGWIAGAQSENEAAPVAEPAPSPATTNEREEFEKWATTGYWMVPARNITEAISKAKRETSIGWELESAILVEGDFIMPTKSKPDSR